MGCLGDYCQCCSKKLGEFEAYRCNDCPSNEYCGWCGKCTKHCNPSDHDRVTCTAPGCTMTNTAHWPKGHLFNL